MSNFYCETCGTAIIDSPDGCVTGCEHYPIERTSFSGFIRNATEAEKEAVYREVLIRASERQKRRMD